MRRLLALSLFAALSFAGLAGVASAQEQDGGQEQEQEQVEEQEREQERPCEGMMGPEQRDCMRRLCEQEPDHEACPDPAPRGPRDPRTDGPPDERPQQRPDPAGDPRARDEGRDVPARGPELARQGMGHICRDRAEQCQAWKEASDLRWIAFDLAQDPPTITNYTVGGLRVADSIELDAGGQVRLERGPATLVVGDADSRLAIHDNPTGLVSFQGRDGNVTFRLPAGAVLELGDQTDAQAGRIAYGDGRFAFVRGANLTITSDGDGDGQVLTAQRFMALHVPPQDLQARGLDTLPGQVPGSPRIDAPPSLGPLPPIGSERLAIAIEKGHLGADMRVQPRGAVPVLGAGVDTVDQPQTQVLAYDDIHVTFANVPDVATADQPLKVVLSAELATGRAFSMTIDPAMVPGLDPLDPATWAVAYFDVQADGSETPAQIRLADSLEDVLDPSDDDVAEYWLVVDPDGVQLLFMVPHWSTHALTFVTLADIAEVVTDPPIVIGVVAGVSGAFLAAAMVLWPRRRDE